MKISVIAVILFLISFNGHGQKPGYEEKLFGKVKEINWVSGGGAANTLELFDENGNREVMNYNFEGHPDANFRKEYTFIDNKLKLVKQYDANNQLSRIEKFEYVGDSIFIKTYNKENEVDTDFGIKVVGHHFTRIDDHRERTNNQGDILPEITTKFEFNSDGFHDKIIKNGGETIIRYEYLDFDDNGNWTKRNQLYYENGEKERSYSYIEEREISYY